MTACLRRTVPFMMVPLFALLVGCTATKSVTITTEPSGADIFVNGVAKGLSPLGPIRLDFSESREYTILAKKESTHAEGRDIWEGSGVVVLAPKKQTTYHIAMEKVLFVPSQRTEAEGGKLVSRPVLAYLEVIERSPNVKSVTRVTDNKQLDIELSAPVLSPMEDLLVYCGYERNTDGKVTSSNVWKQTIGSFARTRLTFGTSHDVSPAFTGDGNHIAFASDRAGMNWMLWRINVKKPGGITKVTGSDARDYAPSVCPLTGRIAYESIPTGAVDAQIWTINANGSLPTQLREGVSPQISPDGQKILFVRKDTKNGRTQIWCMDVDGGQETQLTQNDTSDNIQPRWSPDGKWIVFASNEGLDMNKRPNYDIWMMRSSGSDRIQLTTNGSHDAGACWDHTGRYIYFRSNRGGLWNIWRFEPMIPDEAVAGTAGPAAQ